MAEAVTRRAREARRSMPSLTHPFREQPKRTNMPDQRPPIPERPIVKDSGLLERISSALVYAGLLVCLLYPYADYDWGWHYRYGEYLLTHGRILRHDIYSWSTPLRRPPIRARLRYVSINAVSSAQTWSTWRARVAKSALL